MQQFDKVRAKFKPTVLETLRPEFQPIIGQVREWEALWLIEEGMYAGDWAMGATEVTEGAPTRWVPSRDLEIQP